MGWISNLIKSITNAGSLAYDIAKDQSLTGAQREANAFSSDEAEKARRFNAGEAELARNFESAQAEVARDWQEQQYLKYNSPAAQVRQYQDAGLNPALLAGGIQSAASTSTSIPSGVAASGSAASSVAPSGIGSMLQLLTGVKDLIAGIQVKRAQKENIEADTANKRQSFEWNPKLWSDQLKTGEVNRQNMLAGVDVALANIKHLGVQDSLTEEMKSKIRAEIGKINSETLKIDAETGRIQVDTKLLDEKVVSEILNQGLISAQTVLARSNSDKVNLDVIREQWIKDFRDYTGAEPGGNIWNVLLDQVRSGRVNFFKKRGISPENN